VDVLLRVGLGGARVVGRFDCFVGTSKERVAKKYGVVGVNVRAEKAR
jgi:hypothetical protein